jgi:hypothetical protein
VDRQGNRRGLNRAKLEHGHAHSKEANLKVGLYHFFVSFDLFVVFVLQ